MKTRIRSIAAVLLCAAILAACTDDGEVAIGRRTGAATANLAAFTPGTAVVTPSAAAATSTPAPPTATPDDVVVVDLNAHTSAAKQTAKASPRATAPRSAVPAVAPASAADTAAAIAAEVKKFMVIAGRYYDSYGYSSNHYRYTAAELKMLAIVIHMEARGEPYRAKLAVANVVMNRVLASGYPGSTIKQVVTRPNQFCYKASVTPSAECVRAARDVLDNEVWVVPQNTYFFRSTGSKSNWGRHKYWGHIDNTAFYQDRYTGRYNGNSVPPQLFERVYKWPQYGCKPAARVRKIQAMLKGLGYTVTADGYFGAETKKALVKFQGDNRLKADGVAGPATLRTLIKKYGLSKYRKL